MKHRLKSGRSNLHYIMCYHTMVETAAKTTWFDIPDAATVRKTGMNITIWIGDAPLPASQIRVSPSVPQPCEPIRPCEWQP